MARFPDDQKDEEKSGKEFCGRPDQEADDEGKRGEFEAEPPGKGQEGEEKPEQCEPGGPAGDLQWGWDVGWVPANQVDDPEEKRSEKEQAQRREKIHE